MPVMDGLELLAQINAIPTRLVKGVVLSAYSDMGNIRTAMNHGAFDFLTKPIDFADFETTLCRTRDALKSERLGIESRERLSALEQEIDIAAQIQRSMLPREFPSGGAFDIYAEMAPARRVGGDFFDFFLIGKECLGFLIGDVAGKGVPAALFMAVSRTLLRATALDGRDPAACLTYVNKVLGAQCEGAVYVTVFYGILHMGTGDVVSVSRQGEPGIVAVFEERPQAYAERAASLGLDLETPQKDGKLTILYLRPLDLSVDETMHSILDAVQKIGAKRLVIDSLAGFEMALSPGFRADFRESLYRMIFALTGIGVTILSTVEVDESFTEFPFSTYSISFLTDDIVRLRYVSIDGQLRKIMVVIKMRGGNHAKDIREYEITSKGVVILGKRLTNYQGLISGIPVYSDRSDSKEEPS
jgi:KaiC/GvpD/RAD55 family RecA-like ATPase